MKILVVHGALVRDGAWWWARQSAILSAEADQLSIGDAGDGTLRVAGSDADSFCARFRLDVEDPAVRAGAWDRLATQAVGAFVIRDERGRLAPSGLDLPRLRGGPQHLRRPPAPARRARDQNRRPADR